MVPAAAHVQWASLHGMKYANSRIEWTEANRLFLASEFARVKAQLAGNPESDSPRREISHCMDAPPAIDRLSALFGLSPFERDIVLLTAGIEMDSGGQQNDEIGRENV